MVIRSKFNEGLRAGTGAAIVEPGNDRRVGPRQLICHDSLNFERTNHNDKANDNTSTKLSGGGANRLPPDYTGLSRAASGESDGSNSLLPVATHNRNHRCRPLALQVAQLQVNGRKRAEASGLPVSAATTRLQVRAETAQWPQQCYRNYRQTTTHNSYWRPIGGGRQQVSPRRELSSGGGLRLKLRLEDCRGGPNGLVNSSYSAYSITLLTTLLISVQLFVATVPLVDGYASGSSHWLLDERPVFNDPSCATSITHLADYDSEQAHKMLLLLKCDLKPLIETFESLLRAHSSAANTLASQPPQQHLLNRLTLMAQSIEPFYQEAMFIFSRKNFCTYPVVERFGRLKELGHDLLGSVYDVLAIDFHKSCLVEVIGRLPQVPYLVRDVVEIYMGDVASALPDLNTKPKVFTEAAEEMDQFDVDQALARNGPLERVIELVLMPGLGSSVQDFKDKCKEFLIEIDERWQSMEMMSRLLSTETNGIKRFNNFVMRQLVPTKYADICSQLSHHST